MTSMVVHPPVNIRILHTDGSHTPIETMYTGTTPDGVDHWHSVRDVNLNPGDRPAWDEMPTNTRVHLYQKGTRT